MDLDLKGRTVLITGASKGIGYACAESFLREGAKVIITGREEGRLKEAAARLNAGGAVNTFAGDLGADEERKRLFAAYPDVDVLVNNAGAIPGGSLFDVDLAKWKASWELKVFGYVHLTTLYLQAMRQRKGGVIVNVIGMAGQEPRWEYVCGSAGNAALMAMTQAAGAKSVDWNVRVVGVNPSPTRTDRIEILFRRKAQENFGDESRWRELQEKLPFGRLAEASEVADVVVMLASARASYVSGSIVELDAGQRNKG